MMKRAMKIWVRKAKGIYQYPRRYTNTKSSHSTPLQKNISTNTSNSNGVTSSARTNFTTNTATRDIATYSTPRIHVRDANTNTNPYRTSRTDANTNTIRDFQPYSTPRIHVRDADTNTNSNRTRVDANTNTNRDFQPSTTPRIHVRDADTNTNPNVSDAYQGTFNDDDNYDSDDDNEDSFSIAFRSNINNSLSPYYKFKSMQKWYYRHVYPKIPIIIIIIIIKVQLCATMQKTSS